MSGQKSDRFVINNIEYDISAIEYPDSFFDINTYDLELMPITTACWRGYIATFEINNENNIVLQKLELRSGIKPTSINGVSPKKNIDNIDGDYYYEDINLILDYTGSIIIANDHIQEYCNLMGFEPPIHYNTVIQLKFSNGLLEYSKDLSEEAAKIREKKNIDKLEDTLKKRIEMIGTDGHKNWIRNCFDLASDDRSILLY